MPTILEEDRGCVIAVAVGDGRAAEDQVVSPSTTPDIEAAALEATRDHQDIVQVVEVVARHLAAPGGENHVPEAARAGLPLDRRLTPNIGSPRRVRGVEARCRDVRPEDATGVAGIILAQATTMIRAERSTAVRMTRPALAGSAGSDRQPVQKRRERRTDRSPMITGPVAAGSPE